MGRLRIAVTVLAVALAGAPTAVAAPMALSNSIPTTVLAPAVRIRPPAPAPAPPADVSPMLRDMLDQVNAERSGHGLAPMRLDDRLVLAAQRHADDQARRGQMTHTGGDGSTLAERVDRVGYDWRSLAENVAYGYGDVASALAGWMASAGHRRNILSANVDLGVGLAYGADGRPYWTQVFAAPR
jgi:uncharacterized protein YkwD